jgi:hypothetical protein
MGLVLDEGAVQELVAASPDPWFGDGVHSRHLDSLEEVAGEQRIGLGAEEADLGGSGALGCRVDPGLPEDLPYVEAAILMPRTSSSPWMRR